MKSGRQFLAIPVDKSGESTRLIRSAVFVMVFFVGGAAAWASFAHMSGAVVATGIVKIDTNTKSVQHLEGGIIREIMVREGDHVDFGQPLIVLEDTEASSQLNILTDVLNTQLAREARLMAEASLSDVIDLPKTLSNDQPEQMQTLMRNEDALFRAKRKMLLDQIELIEEQIAHENDAVASLESQIIATEQGVQYVEEQLQAGERLTEQRAIDRNSVLEMRRKLSQETQLLWEKRADLALRKQSMSGLRLEIVNLKNEYSKTAEDELKETRQLIFEAREKIRPVLDSLQRRTIKATIAGQVINLQATSLGGVIRPGETILDIVPAERDLIFEIKVKPQDSDSVHVGQATKIQLSAFNQQSTPLADGVITYISGDAIEPVNTQEAPYFLAHVKADEDTIKLPKDRTLSPGMPIVAFVQTQPRTFFEYIASPFTSGMRKALVEDIQ